MKVIEILFDKLCEAFDELKSENTIISKVAATHSIKELIETIHQVSRLAHNRVEDEAFI